ncbi:PLASMODESMATA CALLOSE-BINDING PROTEIN 5-like [Solanum stenotomum]|uniref:PLASMODESMATA CALLOSE-BINDING PROTEIN 5-like n=1 Tax=Solanum stenotomum TaxID=172797 RepID=UPI0020D10996|nr:PLASMODESMATA CALLOSE-BINDING PROTEIN 5-like [Solanum stenotomum]
MSLKFSFSLLLFSLISTLSTAQFGGTGSAPGGTGTTPGGTGTTPGGVGTTPGGAVTSPSGVGSAPGGTSAAPAGGTATGGGGGGGGGATVELWCVAKNNAEDTALQSALDWACGPGGANCGPIQPGGSCYDPKDIQKTASYVFNDYFIKHGMTEDACNFDNTAALISINPSHNGCKFPSSKNSSGSSSGSTNGGLSPSSEDLSSGSSILRRWMYILMAINLLFASQLIF